MLELNKIYCGDCLELMKEIPDKSIDLVLTDPPYGINYLSNYYVDKNPFKLITNDTKFDFFEIYWDNIKSKLKDDGCALIFHSYKQPFPNIAKNIIIWVKNNWSAGDLEGDFGNQYESIAYIPMPKFKLKSYRYSNVWHYDRVPPTKLTHPTEKPVELLCRCVESCCDIGGTVLDPFCGSGSSLHAAHIMNRKYIGIEIDTSHFNTAKNRIESINKQLRLF